MSKLTAFLADKWVHVLVVAVCAAAPAAAQAAGIDSSFVNALFAIIAGGTGAHAGLTH